MMKKRDKSVRILAASGIMLIIPFVFSLAGEINAKEGYFLPPGQKIKQIVHRYNELLKDNEQDRKEIREEIKQEKQEVVEEVKSSRDESESDTGTADPTATSTPGSPSPTKIVPKVTIQPSPVPPTPQPESTSPQKNSACHRSGGTWREMPNSCGDSCALLEDPGLMCLQVTSENCDCGPNMCWDGSSCVNNPVVLGKKNPTPTLEIPPPINDEPICGNGICEVDEEGVGYICPTCDESEGPCPMKACYHEPGTCPKDCINKPVEPIIR